MTPNADQPDGGLPQPLFMIEYQQAYDHILINIDNAGDRDMLGEGIPKDQQHKAQQQ